jgi:hypothetical protein
LAIGWMQSMDRKKGTEVPAMLRRHRARSTPHTFEDRIAAEKARTEAAAAKLPHGPARDVLLRKIRQLNTAAHMQEWLTSPGLRTPK